MAHKRSSKKTSFGKRSDAEKAFVKKGKNSKKEEAEDKPARSFRKTSSSSPTSRFGKSAAGRSTRYEKPTFTKRGSTDKRASDKPTRSFRKFSDDASEKPKFTKRDRSDKPDRPYKRSAASDSESRSQSGPRRTSSANRGDFKKKHSDTPSFSRDKKEDRRSSRSEKSPTSLGFTKRGKSSVKTRPTYATQEKKEDGLTRLNKYIANSGMGSRREADEMIKLGLISVNGVTITEMGYKVKQGDVVRHEDKILKSEKPVYVLLNKPKGFITTTADPKERKTVMGLVAAACKERIYPVGRLDRNTTGLLLLTNDGDLADKLTHPSYKAKKVYQVELDKPLSKVDFQKIVNGVHLEEGKALVDDVAIISDDKKSIGLEIHIGWNRIVRRIFEAIGYEVVKLDRVMYAGLDKKDLPRGEWRFLKPEEVVRMKHFK